MLHIYIDIKIHLKQSITIEFSYMYVPFFFNGNFPSVEFKKEFVEI